MNNSLQNQAGRPTFIFPTIFYGVETSVAVVRNERDYGIHLNGEFMARLMRNDDINSWFVAGGELNDPDLVQEIGQRIEVRYN